ncbi:dethiobiotin synthase [Lysobacter sp. TAB13]|uniref:dethiobiotin synthase n=1 Tax=Lysobacter sp. TAB13 TaxID=3233065 RepID=UPI003F9D9E64
MPPRAYLPGLFVTGTDTGVGKSVVSASLLHAIRALGARAIGMKPVASGCEPGAQGWRNEDALLLQAASDPTPRYEDVNPYALPLALAPEIAAAEAGIEIGLEPILAAYARLRAQADVMVVEGVGGWAAPIDARLDQIDLVRALDLPVVLVVGLRLGAINHARLSARAIAADGARFIGWIANDIDPQMARMDENFEILRRRMPVPCWGRVPYSQRPDPARLAESLRPQV